MNRGLRTAIFGISLGVAGLWIYTRLREKAEQESADSLIQQLADQLHALESRFDRVEARAAARKK